MILKPRKDSHKDASSDLLPRKNYTLRLFRWIRLKLHIENCAKLRALVAGSCLLEPRARLLAWNGVYMAHGVIKCTKDVCVQRDLAKLIKNYRCTSRLVASSDAHGQTQSWFPDKMIILTVGKKLLNYSHQTMKSLVPSVSGAPMRKRFIYYRPRRCPEKKWLIWAVIL